MVAHMSRAVFLAAALCAAPAHAETRFLSGMEDVPLAPHLTEQGPGFFFEDANGRITGAVAQGRTTAEAVRRFYTDTLPALGWSLSPNGPGVEGDLVFLRGRERLTL